MGSVKWVMGVVRELWEDLPHALPDRPELNPYTMRANMEAYFQKVGGYMEAATEGGGSGAAIDEEDLSWEQEVELQECESVAETMECVESPVTELVIDPLQPKPHVLTHPIAIECLIAFVNSSKVQKMLTKNCNCRSTSMVESYNSLICVYAPKRKHCSKSHKAHVGMATLDWNENIGRTVFESGKTGRLYVRHRDKTYSWQQSVMLDMLGEVLW